MAESEDILQTFREAGRLESEGEFTVRTTRALEALGAFQLPFEGAWAVKVVQAVVAQGTSQAIHVKRTRRHTQFHFDLESNWSWGKIEDEYFTAALGEDSSLNHLKVALWSLSLGEQRECRLYLGGETQCIVVQKGQLTHKLLSKASPCSFLEVEHGSAKATSEHVELDRALRERCFVCPVPLYLDARRIDALCFCPSQGWSQTRWPLGMGFVQEELPSLTIPQGTFAGLDRRERRSSHLPLPDPSADIPPSGQASLIFQFAFHARLPASVPDWVNEGQASNGELETLQGRSYLHWLLDGALIQSERISVSPENAFSLGLYLSAEGLERDLTSLQLRESNNRTERERQAWRAFLKVLPEVHWTFENSASSGSLLSLGLTFTGILGLALPGVQSLIGCGAISLGLAGYFNSRKVIPWAKKIERIQTIQKEFRTFRASLK